MIATPRELYVERLRTMLHVEQTLAETVLPQLYEAVHATALKKAVARHLRETEEHVRIVERILAAAGGAVAPVDSPAIVGLTVEHELMVAQVDGAAGPVLDLVHAQAAAATEHLEIAGYHALQGMATELGEGEAASLLQGILDQELAALEFAQRAATEVLAKVEA